MRRSPGKKSASAKAISTLQRHTRTGLLPFRQKGVSLPAHSPFLIWESLFIVEQSAQRCSCSFGKRSLTEPRTGPTDIYPLEGDSRSSRAPWKLFQSTSSKLSSQRSVLSNSWISFWRGSFGVRQMRGKGLTGSARTRSAYQHQKEASVFVALKRSSEPSLSSFGGDSGSKTPSGLGI